MKGGEQWLMMAVNGEETRWMCGRTGIVILLHPVNSTVRETREPCLQHCPTRVSDNICISGTPSEGCRSGTHREMMRSLPTETVRGEI